MLLAQEVAARVPHVVIAGTSGPLAVLVTEEVHGHPLDADAVDDAWEQVRILHARAHRARPPRRRAPHRQRRREHRPGDGKVTVVGWGRATSGANDRQLDADVAHLLAASAAIVGADRAVAAAIHGVGKEHVAAALPLIQPGVLSGVTRSALDDTEAAARAWPSSPNGLRRRSARTLRSSRSCTGSILAVC